MALLVNEIFYSLQGESTYAGLPCVFIRLTGCNLRCAYCDTDYAYKEGEAYDIGRLVAVTESFGCPMVEITGGEPLIQSDTLLLVDRLLSKHFQVLMETNGSQDISRVDARCIRIVDIKGPSSGEAANNDWENLNRLTPDDELKFVIGDRNDYQYAREIVLGLNIEQRKTGKIHFSPVFGLLPVEQLSQWILQDQLNVRLQLQLHKYIWDPDTRGV